MRYIASHGFEFGVDTENTHNQDLAGAASEKVQAALDAMGPDRVASVHANLKAVTGGNEDDISEDCNDVCASACAVSAHEDFIVTLTAY